MSVIENAVQWVLSIAYDNSHGYSQNVRWGPSYDCSSLVISAYQQAGVPVKTKGATYTGDMYHTFLACGFKDVTGMCNLNTAAGMRRGDVLLNKVNHAAMYIGNGQLVHARSSEGTSDTADNSGNEIRSQGYWNYPWDCILRYAGEDSASEYASELQEDNLRIGMSGSAVKELQAQLIKAGYSCGSWGADGDFGNDTLAAVKAFQKDHNLDVTGSADKKFIDTLNNVVNGSESVSNLSHASLPAGREKCSYGEIGVKVKDLQTALISLGYSCGAWGADGEYGDGTQAAVNKFKADNKLTEDGAGAQTWSRIEELLNSKTSEKKDNFKIDSGDIIRIKGSKYYNGLTIPPWVLAKEWVVLTVNDDRVVVNRDAAGTSAIMSALNIKDIELVSKTPDPTAGA